MAKRAVKPVNPDPQAVVRGKFIEQGTDPVIAKKALEDATSVSRGLWLSFLTFGTYLVITFAGITHRDMLLETPITLPVLNAKLPLVTFFWVAPILFVIFHLYLLLSLKLLADQVHNYVGQMEEVGLDTDAQDRARLQLPNFVMVQVLGGTSSQINSWAGKLLNFTAFLTLVAGPLILLLFAQLMFLPYHGWWVTMAQRVMVTADLVLLWYFWRAIRKPQAEVFHFRGAAASVAMVVFSFFGFMYPGERFYGLLPQAMFDETGANEDFSSHLEEIGLAVFYNTLVLPGQRFVDDDLFKKLEARNHEKGQKSWDGERSFDEVLKYRDFRQADFRNIDLRKADLSYSNLDNAGLGYASLQGASLKGASLQGAALDQASLQGASLDSASLQSASFGRTSLQGASLNSASLQGVSLYETSLQGASLESAKLQGAFLHRGSLEGASLKHAKLQGATLHRASLQGASLKWASLQGATLVGVSLQGAALEAAQMQGASLYGTSLQGTSLRWASLGGTTFMHTSLQGTFLRLADLTGVALSENIAPHQDDHPGVTREFYELTLSAALEGVPESEVEKLVNQLSRLDPSAPGPRDMFDWPKAMNAMAVMPDFKAQMTQSLIATACEVAAAPYVAQGIVGARFDSSDGDLGKAALPLVEKLLKGCPGTKGMNQETIDRLNQLKAAFSSGAAEPSSSEKN